MPISRFLYSKSFMMNSRKLTDDAATLVNPPLSILKEHIKS